MMGNRPLSSAAKGYGYRWKLARADHLRRYPLCVFCQAQGFSVAAPTGSGVD